MAPLVRPLAAALALVCLAPLPVTLAPKIALAQTQPAAAPDEPMKQMALTDAQVQAYIAAAADIDPLLAKLAPSDDNSVDPKLLAALEAAAKKHSFASFDDFQDVGANIGLVMDGIDAQTRKYVGADVMLKQQIAAVEAEPKMAAADKKQALAELNDALKSVEPLKNPGNVAVVAKYYDQLAGDDAQSK